MIVKLVISGAASYVVVFLLFVLRYDTFGGHDFQKCGIIASKYSLIGNFVLFLHEQV